MAKLELLRRQVEDLAIQLVVGDTANAPGEAGWVWAQSLERIRDEALREQAGEIAEIAGTILETLQRRMISPASDGPELGDELQAGITRLQQAMESPAADGGKQAETLAQDPELLADFVLESREHLARIETEVLTLERDPRDSESLNAVFRGFHTIKGLAGFLELWEVQKLAHEVEAVLDRARNGELVITPTAIDVALASADHLRRWLVHLELAANQQPTQAPADDPVLFSRIRALSAAPSAAENSGAALEALAAAVATPRLESPKDSSQAEAVGPPAAKLWL